ncbi:MAG: hypothetical protein ACRD2C_09535 [Acidimicrobiales bacterium]
MRAHRVVVERDAHDWAVRIEGSAARRVLSARDLADVDPRCRKAIAEQSGQAPDDIELEVEVQLPPAVQDRLDIIRELTADIEAEYDAAISELVEVGLSLTDISQVLRQNHRPLRALIVTNAEIAEHGLAGHPDAVGLAWDDHGHCETLKCRRHVEATRCEYRDLPPEGENALVYDSNRFTCDFCDGEEMGG